MIRLGGARGVLVAVLAVLLATSPALGQSEPETPQPDTTEPSEGDSSGDGEEAFDCDAIVTEGGWSESEFLQVLDCLLDRPATSGGGVGELGTPPTKTGPGRVGRSSGACGDVSVRYEVQQYLPRRGFFGFVREHLRIYLAELLCADGSPAVGYATGLQIIRGPGSGGFSSWCWVLRGGRVEEVRTSSANGCPSYDIATSDFGGVLAHLHRVNGSNDRSFRQVVMWADLDRDGRHDAGEPYDLTFSPDDGQSDRFAARGVAGPRLVRSGGLAEQVVRFADPADVSLAGVRVGAEVVSGPSTRATVSCFAQGRGGVSVVIRPSDCTTDGNGGVRLSWRLGAVSRDLHRQDLDVLRVYIDENANGRFDGSEPFRYLTQRIAKPINYVALGDSYSAGEHGLPAAQLPGEGYFDTKPADLECRRWTQAYSQVLDGYLQGTDLTVGLYACTGAITYNIHDPRVTSTRLHSETDRPSAAVPEQFPDVLPALPDPNWEPRQAVSLADAHALRSVDMVTITIGGNDLGFGPVVHKCVDPRSVSDCSADDQTITFDALEERLSAVLAQVKSAAPGSAIFVLGYPYHAPTLVSIPVCTELGLVPLLTEGIDSPVGGFFAGLVYETLSTLSTLFDDGPLDVTQSELGFLRRSAITLNDRLEAASRKVGVHFVEVAHATASTSGAESFDGHFPCGNKEAWLYGVAAESESDDAFPTSDRSFHPTRAGHAAYARLLAQFIRNAVDRGAELTEAGLPGNPAPDPSGGSTTTGSAVGGASDATAQQSTGDASVSRVFLVARRQTPVASGCGVSFAAPGDQLELTASGFAASSSVTFTVAGAKLSGTALSGLSIPAATTDGDGDLSVVWAVPTAPAAGVDAVPRAYMIEASGTDASSGQVVARLLQPIVAYPGTKPCAVDDAATTTVGRSVRIPLLSNDVAPEGGSLDVTSVQVTPTGGGSFAVSSTDGSATFTPDPGFVGDVATQYWVFDDSGVGVSGDVTVTVNAGCTITGAAGVTNIDGTDGDDVICVSDSGDREAFHIIDAKAGNDVIIAGDGVDWIRGGPGRDTIYGRDGADRIDGGPGSDTVYGGGDFDTIYSDDLTDVVRDDAGGFEIILAAPVPQNSAPVAADDTEHAATGETLLLDVLGNDFDADGNLDASTLTITQAPTAGAAQIVTSDDLGAHVSYTAAGTAGADTFTYQICDHRGDCATAQVTVTVGTTHCTIVGTAGDDTLRGTSGADVICGLAGNDTIYGLDGDDILIGGPGDDTIYGGNETRIGINDGDDTLFGGPGDDTLYGGNGDDTLWGGPGDDTLEGNRRDDTLVGGAGDDSLNGGGEDDTLWGGPGNDTLEGHADDDALHGGLGDDTLEGGNGDDTLRGGPGNDTLTGHAGNDTLWGDVGDDTLHGNTQNDTLRGGPGHDTLHGGGHNDHLHGNSGDDTLNGNSGNDHLWGGPDSDTLHGGNGTDYLNGGTGTDTCTQGETNAQCAN